MSRYLCLHLHFYQPPRENPWLGEIEYQESAYPFHDWNERIDRECYRSNGASRILDSDGRVIDLSNNYAKTSFNFGPTLLSWLENKAPTTYERILEGDRLSLEKFGGHGSAIAQVYNHVIMPLAHWRDKETQVLWGLRDFESRFQRQPEAMWLPETAVDTETLEVLSLHGMKYVILAPRQAQAVRKLDTDEPWHDVSFEKVDPKQPYLIRLPSGRSIVAFFYDGPISKAVAFEGLLHNGETFARRLLEGFSGSSTNPQLLHIATDGETYGHHHTNGDMALAYALWYLEGHNLASITNYGQFLEVCPPKYEARIHENSSWSCVHGIERWRSDCGCNSGMRGDWHQRWRAPFRKALECVREKVEEPYEKQLSQFTDDPWGARNDFISVVKDRSLANIEVFLAKWCRGQKLSTEQTTFVLKTLESQHHLLLMFTSCAWFFDEISGLETVQNLQYAYRAIELAEAAFGIELLEDFLGQLEGAESNLLEIENGRNTFERYVRPAHVGHLRAGAHFAVTSVFEQYGQKNEVYQYKITLLDFARFESGRARMACGQARIRSRATLERHRMTFGVIHLGDHNVSAGIKFFESDTKYNSLLKEARTAFEKADFPAVIRVFDRYFESSQFSLKDMFKDEQKKIVDLIMSQAMQETEERFARLYQNNYPLLCYLSDLHFPMPKVFSHIAEFVQNRGIRKTLLTDQRIRTDLVQKYLAEAKSWGVPFDAVGLARILEQAIERKTGEFENDEKDFDRLEELLELVELETEVPFKINLGTVQNWFFLWYKSLVANNNAAEAGDDQRWNELVARLGKRLRVKLPYGVPGGLNVSGNVSDSAAQEVSTQ